MCSSMEQKMTMFSDRLPAAIRFVTVLTVAIFVGVAHANMYRCTDPNGAVAFSDRPCQNSKQESVDMRYKYDKAKPVAPQPDVNTPTKSNSSSQPNSTENAPIPSKGPAVSLEDGLAALCVDQYRKHLAYPKGVQITGRTLEKRLDEMHIVVNVRTITNPATPTNIDPIFLNEKFICVTDFGSALNQRSTDIFVARHKRGQRL